MSTTGTKFWGIWFKGERQLPAGWCEVDGEICFAAYTSPGKAQHVLKRDAGLRKDVYEVRPMPAGMRVWNYDLDIEDVTAAHEPAKRGSIGRYVSAVGQLIEGIVRRVHKDGNLTVEARFFLKENGERIPGYLGYRFVIPADRFSPVTQMARWNDWELRSSLIPGEEHPIIQRGREGGFLVKGLSREQEIADAHMLVSAPKMYQTLGKIAEKHCRGLCRLTGGLYLDCDGCVARAAMFQAEGRR